MCIKYLIYAGFHKNFIHVTSYFLKPMKLLKAITSTPYVTNAIQVPESDSHILMEVPFMHCYWGNLTLQPGKTHPAVSQLPFHYCLSRPSPTFLSMAAETLHGGSHSMSVLCQQPRQTLCLRSSSTRSHLPHEATRKTRAIDL